MDAKDAIKAQFLSEYMKRDFSQISVKGLCAAAPVARTTFYAYFSNTDDVRALIEDEIISGLEAVTASASNGSLPDMRFDLFMDAVEAYIKENWTAIHAFLVVQPNLRFIRKWKDNIILHFGERYPDKKRTPHFEAVAEVMASSMISAYTFWMEHPEQVSTREIKPMIHQVLDALVKVL